MQCSATVEDTFSRGLLAANPSGKINKENSMEHVFDYNSMKSPITCVQTQTRMKIPRPIVFSRPHYTLECTFPQCDKKNLWDCDYECEIVKHEPTESGRDDTISAILQNIDNEVSLDTSIETAIQNIINDAPQFEDNYTVLEGIFPHLQASRFYLQNVRRGHGEMKQRLLKEMLYNIAFQDDVENEIKEDDLTTYHEKSRYPAAQKAKQLHLTTTKRTTQAE